MESNDRRHYRATTENETDAKKKTQIHDLRRVHCANVPYLRARARYRHTLNAQQKAK